MAGFERSTLKIDFDEDHELYGLEIRARRLSVYDLQSIAALAKFNEAKTTDERKDMLDQLFGVLGSRLIDWNLEDNGEPVPANSKGLSEQDQGLVMAFMNALMTASVGVPDPLAPGSSDGERFPVPSIPMEALSPNQSS